MWLSNAALAAVTEDDLARIVRELKPAIEARAGSPMGAVPAVAIDDEAHVLQALLQTVPSDDAAKAAAEQRIRALTSKALALYAPREHRVYFLSDRFRTLLREHGAVSSEVEDIVRCVAAHELVHAVQAKRPPPGGSRLDPQVELALLEGQANHVASRLCSPRAISLADSLTGSGGASSTDPNDPDAFTYEYGTAFTGVYARRYGDENLWQLQARDDLRREDIVEVVRRAVPEAWRTDAALATFLPRFHEGPLGAVVGRAVGTQGFLGTLTPDAQAPRSTVGRWVRAEGGRWFTGILGAWLTHPEEGVSWLAERTAAWNPARGTIMLPTVIPDVKTFKEFPSSPIYRRAGVDHGLELAAQTTQGWYHEAWVIEGNVLIGAWRHGTSEARTLVAQAATAAAAQMAAFPADLSDPEVEKILSRLAP